jgi:hypothetical protein
MRALTRDGGAARFVGGSVRNALLGEPVVDIDIATPLEPTEVIGRLKQSGLNAVPTGIEHGTVTAISSGKPFEVTTLRRDVSTDGRRATVAFTTEWSEDAARRDFTINALYAGEDGEIFEVPLEYLCNPGNRSRMSVERQGVIREFHTIPFAGHTIWGATAEIIINLTGRLSA